MKPTLQMIFEEMKHPAFNEATVVKRAFEKGVKAYGEEQAITYWESKKEDYMNHYQENLTKVETELNSPVLKNFSENWKNQTFETAKEDPAKALDFLHQFKEKEMVRQEKAATVAQAEAKQEHIQGIYRQYWQTEKMIKDSPSARPHFKDHLENLAKEMFQDKHFMEKLKVSDADDAKRIEHLAVGKT